MAPQVAETLAAKKHTMRKNSSAGSGQSLRLFVAILCLGSVYTGCSRSRSLADAPLPPLPDLTSRPAELRERLNTANSTAATTHSPDAVAELGILYHINGFSAAAEQCWNTLRAAQPREPKWVYYLADLRRTAGDYDADEALLQDTVRLAPDYAPAWLQLGNLQLKSGRYDLAEQSYQKRLSLLAGDPYARLGLVRIALQQEHRDAGRHQLEELVRDHPKFQPALNLYAEMLSAAGEEKAATEQRFRASAVNRFREADDPWIEAMYPYLYDPQRLAILGTIDSQTKHGDQGRGFLERALRLAPDNRDCAKALSNLYLTLGEVERAKEMLDRTIPRIKPPDPILLANRCEVARLQQHGEEALQLVDAALKLLPNSYELHNERGGILGDMGRFQESAASYREALARAPTDTDSNYSLGLDLFALGHRDEAIAYFKRSLQLQPTFPKALNMLGHIAIDAGDLVEAEQYIRPLYEQHQDQQIARHLMALWYQKSGEAALAKEDSAAAEAHFRAAFAIEPKNGAIGMNLGTLYLMQGKPADAIPPLETFRRSAPDDPSSALFLGQAYAQTGKTAEARALLREGEATARKRGDAKTADFCHEILSQL